MHSKLQTKAEPSWSWYWLLRAGSQKCSNLFPGLLKQILNLNWGEVSVCPGPLNFYTGIQYKWLPNCFFLGMWLYWKPVLLVMVNHCPVQRQGSEAFAVQGRCMMEEQWLCLPSTSGLHLFLVPLPQPYLSWFFCSLWWLLLAHLLGTAEFPFPPWFEYSLPCLFQSVVLTQPGLGGCLCSSL